MTWNNRIFRHVDKHRGEEHVWYGLHETFYDDAGAVRSFTAEPMGGGFDSVDDLIGTLEQQLADAKRFRDNVLEYDIEPLPPPPAV